MKVFRVLTGCVLFSGMLFASNVLTDTEHHFTAHWDDMLVGVTLTGLLGHAVQSFPRSKNPYINWLIGCAQWVVGQRQRAMGTLSANPQNRE